MRKLLGYCCHVASVQLHEAAVGLLEVDDFDDGPPSITIERECSACRGSLGVPVGDHEQDWCDCGCGFQYDPITLADVAPRLATAREAVRGHVERVRRRIGL